MVFNVLCRNLDDHPRNHGFLVDTEGVPYLAPAFDITPTPSFPGITTMPSQAMTVGIYGREGTLRNALSRPEIFGLTGAEAEVVVSEMLHRLSGWRRRFEEAGVSEKDAEMFKNSLETRWADEYPDHRDNIAALPRTRP
jgi:serine/threonine-protein kinase HipA